MALTAGRSTNCLAENIGGVARLWLADRASVASVTVGGTDGDFTAITMAATKVFYEFQFLEESLEFTEDGAITNDSSVFTQKLLGTWRSWSQTDRKRLVDLYTASRCGLVGIAELESGDCVLIGINASKPTVTNKYTLKMETSAFKSGKKFDDATGNDIVLVARSGSPVSKFTPGAAGVPLT
jgi:hypothetical protein